MGVIHVITYAMELNMTTHVVVPQRAVCSLFIIFENIPHFICVAVKNSLPSAIFKLLCTNFSEDYRYFSFTTYIKLILSLLLTTLRECNSHVLGVEKV